MKDRFHFLTGKPKVSASDCFAFKRLCVVGQIIPGIHNGSNQFTSLLVIPDVRFIWIYDPFYSLAKTYFVPIIYSIS